MNTSRINNLINNSESLEDVKNVLFSLLDEIEYQRKQDDFTMKNLTSDNVTRLDGRTIFEKPLLASQDWVLDPDVGIKKWVTTNFVHK